MSDREWFPYPYRECVVLFPNRCGISQPTLLSLQGPTSSLALVPFTNQCGTPQSTLLQGPASLLPHRLMSTSLLCSATSLAHRLVSGSGTICNNSIPPLADIVLFGGLSLKVFKTPMLGRGFHTLIENVSFSSLTNVGSHNPPLSPFEV